MKFRTRAAAEEMLAKILKVLHILKDAEEAVEYDFFKTVVNISPNPPGRLLIHRVTCKNTQNAFAHRHNTRYIEAGLNYRKHLWPLNKCLLDDHCPKAWEFELVEEPTVFIKVPDIKLTNDEHSLRVIQYTDPWQHLNSY